MSSSLLCKRLRSRSTCNSNTAHSTSYYTLDKLSHIRQASTHSRSYRTHTLKSIPRISLYTQVHPAAVVLPFVRFLQAIFHCEIDVQVGNGRLNYINGYVSKDHDAVDVGMGEYKQKGAAAPWLSTYRLLSKSSPSIPEVHNAQFMYYTEMTNMRQRTSKKCLSVGFGTSLRKYQKNDLKMSEVRRADVWISLVVH